MSYYDFLNDLIFLLDKITKPKKSKLEFLLANSLSSNDLHLLTSLPCRNRISSLANFHVYIVWIFKFPVRFFFLRRLSVSVTVLSVERQFQFSGFDRLRKSICSIVHFASFRVQHRISIEWKQKNNSGTFVRACVTLWHSSIAYESHRRFSFTRIHFTSHLTLLSHFISGYLFRFLKWFVWVHLRINFRYLRFV